MGHIWPPRLGFGNFGSGASLHFPYASYFASTELKNVAVVERNREFSFIWKKWSHTLKSQYIHTHTGCRARSVGAASLAMGIREGLGCKQSTLLGLKDFSPKSGNKKVIIWHFEWPYFVECYQGRSWKEGQYVPHPDSIRRVYLQHLALWQSASLQPQCFHIPFQT